jgi:hypothetical protein
MISWSSGTTDIIGGVAYTQPINFRFLGVKDMTSGLYAIIVKDDQMLRP